MFGRMFLGTAATKAVAACCVGPVHAQGGGGNLDAVLDRLALGRVRDLPFRALSAGQQRRVALARLLLSPAAIWLMDEPFTNLDAAGRDLVIEVMREHLGRGGACLFASHLDVELHPDMPRVRLA